MCCKIKCVICCASWCVRWRDLRVGGQMIIIGATIVRPYTRRANIRPHTLRIHYDNEHYRRQEAQLLQREARKNKAKKSATVWKRNQCNYSDVHTSVFVLADFVPDNNDRKNDVFFLSANIIHRAPINRRWNWRKVCCPINRNTNHDHTLRFFFGCNDRWRFAGCRLDDANTRPPSLPWPLPIRFNK